MKNFVLIVFNILMFFSVFAQTAKVYRSGTLIGTYTMLADASAAANMIGDSILLSAHKFKEHNVPMKGGQIWQGSITATDTSTIDAESKGRVGFKPLGGSIGRACVVRNIICENGTTVGSSTKDGGGFYTLNDSLVLKGFSIIRNCFAERCGGGGTYLYFYF